MLAAVGIGVTEPPAGLQFGATEQSHVAIGVVGTDAVHRVRTGAHAANVASDKTNNAALLALGASVRRTELTDCLAYATRAEQSSARRAASVNGGVPVPSTSQRNHQQTRRKQLPSLHAA